MEQGSKPDNSANERRPQKRPAPLTMSSPIGVQQRKFIGRTTAFKIESAMWPNIKSSSKEQSERRKEKIKITFATSFKYGQGPEIVRIGVQRSGAGSTLFVVISKRNLVSSEQIVQHLQGCVEPKNITKPVHVSPVLSQDLLDLMVKDQAAMPVLYGDMAEIPEGKHVTLEALGMIDGFLVLDRVKGKAELGPPIKRRVYSDCEMCKCPNLPDHEKGAQHQKNLKQRVEKEEELQKDLKIEQD